MATLLLADGSRHDLPAGQPIRDAIRSVAPKFASKAIAAQADGVMIDISAPVPAAGELRLVTKESPESLELLRHSMSHIMAEAVVRLFKDVRLAIGPAIQDGFYYDFDLEHKLTPEDLQQIEAEMKRIVSENAAFQRFELSRADAIAKMREAGQPFKVELIEDLPTGEPITFYQSGNFADLCRGPHIPATGAAGQGFKLLSIAGAYWRGSEKNKMLQRIYGTAFWNPKELNEHLKRVEEAKARDHRLVGKQLELFHLSDAVGPGLVLWMPKGAVIRGELENWIRRELMQRGYQSVYTPHIGRLGLYRTSGHYPYYQDKQYPPIMDREVLDNLSKEGCSCSTLCNRMDEGAIDGYLLKPMNCPHHIEIYKATQHSYRDLPVRLAEFGTVYRFEQSGELGGMVRVRGFTQDDAHLFCTPDQLEGEIESCVELTKLVLQTLGLTDVMVHVSLRDPHSDKYVGSAENWEKAEANLRRVVQKLNMKYVEDVGEAAFYGPKIDFVVRDCIGREWQLGTVQVDYNLPERFGLEYIGADNAAHRPVMVHRAPLGSFERFIGILIEHFGGAFPLWLAPEQVRVLPIAEGQAEYAARVHQALRDAGLRAEINHSNEKIGAKIRQATIEKVPYMVVLGAKEAEQSVVTLRHRKDGDLGAMALDALLARLKTEIQEKR